MPSCPRCNSNEVSVIQDDEMFCSDCECKFMYCDGVGYKEEWNMEVDGDSLDMQEFEDRISCLGDD